jgi:hypothetical protein
MAQQKSIAAVYPGLHYGSFGGIVAYSIDAVCLSTLCFIGQIRNFAIRTLDGFSNRISIDIALHLYQLQDGKKFTIKALLIG